MTAARSAWGYGLATMSDAGPGAGHLVPDACRGDGPSGRRRLRHPARALLARGDRPAPRDVRTQVVRVEIDLDAAPETVPRTPTCACTCSRTGWSSRTRSTSTASSASWSTSCGPAPARAPVDGFERTRLRLRADGPVTVHGVDKFPRMVDYVLPTGVRIADADRVRLGAHLAAGTTVMHEGFVNYNAGTLGTSMVEGRISAGVVVDDGSDIGGGASIMGTLSGGGTQVIRIGKRCLVGANAGVGISLGDDCVVEAGLYVTAGTKVLLAGDTGPAGEGARAVRAARGSCSAATRSAGRSRRCRAPDRASPSTRRCMLTADQAVSASPPGARRRSPAPPRLGGCRGAALAVVLGGGVWYAVGHASKPVLGKGCTAVASRAHGHAGCRAGRQRRDHHSRCGATEAAGARGDHRHGHRAAGVQAAQPRPTATGTRSGLFQQRPSQGWGTKAQVRNPVYAANAFYDVLVKIEGYRTLPVTKAAQKVQRSAFPSAYADHEADARVLASALSGNSAAAFTCVFAPTHSPQQSPGPDGLTPRGRRAGPGRRARAGRHGDRERGQGHLAGPASGQRARAPRPSTAGRSPSGPSPGASSCRWSRSARPSRSWSRTDDPDKWTGRSIDQLSLGHVIVQVA